MNNDSLSLTSAEADNVTATPFGQFGQFGSMEPTPDLPTYIQQRLGPPHLPLSTIVPISALYAVIFAVGVFGNVVTCLVIVKNKYMHTPTNVYLANLAVSDLLTHIVGMDLQFCGHFSIIR